RRHTRSKRDWSSDVCSSDLVSDFLPVPARDRVEVHMIIIIVSVMAFIIYTMVAFIQWIIRKRKKTSSVNMFPATGLLAFIGLARSEERRVGKAWRLRRWTIV